MNNNKETICCDGCEHRDVCREIFVLREILRDETVHLYEGSVPLRTAEILNLLERLNFQYPFAEKRCHLPDNADMDVHILKTMKKLLEELRAQRPVTS